MTPQAALSLRTYSAAVSRHAHDFHQLILPVEGRMELDVGGVDGRVDGAGGALVPGGTLHGFRAEGENRFLIVDLRGFAVDQGLAHLVGYLAHALGGTSLPGALAHRAADLVVDAVMRAGDAAPAGDAAVERAIDVIHARFPEPLTVAVLARAAGLSPSALFERFRRQAGHTPIAYLQEVRLDAAERLLRGSRRSIADIAVSVGFSDQTALTRSLRRRRGVTPAASRRGSA
jgi:AraC-like DNA-binding protein